MIVHADQRQAKYLTNAHWQSGPVRSEFYALSPVRSVWSGPKIIHYRFISSTMILHAVFTCTCEPLIILHVEGT